MSGVHSDALCRGEECERVFRYRFMVSAPLSLLPLLLFTRFSTRRSISVSAMAISAPVLIFFAEFAPAILHNCVGVMGDTAQHNGSGSSVASQCVRRRIRNLTHRQAADCHTVVACLNHRVVAQWIHLTEPFPLRRFLAALAYQQALLRMPRKPLLFQAPRDFSN